MIRPLLRKELRDQRPFLALSLVLLAVSVVDTLLSHPIGHLPLSKTFDATFSASGELSILSCVLAFALGTGLLVRENDDGTLEFLLALPVARFTVFAVKVAIAVAVVVAYPVGYALWLWLHHALSLSSLDSSLHLDILAAGSALRILQALAVLSLSLALSYLRRLGWTILGVFLVAFFTLRESHPWIAVLNPLELTSPSFDGSHWRMPWRSIATHVAVSIVFLGIAYGLFAGIFERWLSRLAGRTARGAAGFVVATATVGLFIGAATLAFDDQEIPVPKMNGPRSADSVEFTPRQPVHAESTRYRFTYPYERRAAAAVLLTQGDQVFEKVRQLLPAPDGPSITVDLTGTPLHTAGLANWDTIRMQLSADEQELLTVLGHETSHVLASRLATREGPPQALGQLELFNEGLATYVEHRFFEPTVAREQHEVVAGAMHARRQVKVAELLDTAKLDSARDRNLVYPLGLLFVERLVARHGESAPSKVLSALAREDAPENLSSAERWLDAFQAAGFDLYRILDELFAVLDQLSRKHRSTIAKLPRPRGAIESEDGRVGVRPVLDTPAPPGWQVVCRFRAHEGTDRLAIDGPFSGQEIFWRSRRETTGSRLWFQLGLQSPSGEVLYEPWTSVPLE